MNKRTKEQIQEWVRVHVSSMLPPEIQTQEDRNEAMLRWWAHDKAEQMRECMDGDSWIDLVLYGLPPLTMDTLIDDLVDAEDLWDDDEDTERDEGWANREESWKEWFRT